MKTLNQEQSAAVESPAPRKLVVAGPGSGKTHTMVAAVAREVAAGAKPEQVVVLTFTNAAADEFSGRLEKATGVPPERWGFVGTLHSFLFRLLRRRGELVGLRSELALLPEESVEQAVKSVAEDMGVKCPYSKVEGVLYWPNLVEGRKGAGRQPHELVAKEFHASLRRDGLLTFETILFYGEKLVKKMDELEELYEGESGEPIWPYKSLFVDEVQDSGAADWRIYDAAPCERKFLVGDPDQSIYGFRGAEVSEMLDRCESGEWEVHLLQANYRSGADICDAANTLIKRNPDRLSKVTDAARDGGEVTAHEAKDPAAEALFVQSVALEEYGKKASLAVLCRTNRAASAARDAVRAVGVPVAERRLPQMPHDWPAAKLVLAAAACPHSSFAQHQALAATKGKAEADRLRAAAAKAMRPLDDFGFRFLSSPGASADEILAAAGVELESREKVAQALESLRAKKRGVGLAELLLEASAAEREEVQVSSGGVFVGTVHGAKGLEFDAVVVCGLEEGTFPSGLSLKAGEKGVAEERRLCFVAVTRARERCRLIWCSERPQNRGPNSPPGPAEKKEPSRFLKEAGL